MPKIEIGAGFVLAALAGVGLQGSLSVTVILFICGIFLILHGGYEEYVKPRFRVDSRLSDWLQRRDWSVSIDSERAFNFVLWAQDESGRKVAITRIRRARNDVLAFTAKVGLDPAWLPKLEAMAQPDRAKLIEDIRILFAAKRIGFNFPEPIWPPNVTIQTGLPLDNHLSQHLVDTTAKDMTHTMIGVRSLIRRAIAESASDTKPSEH